MPYPWKNRLKFWSILVVQIFRAMFPSMEIFIYIIIEKLFESEWYSSKTARSFVPQTCALRVLFAPDSCFIRVDFVEVWNGRNQCEFKKIAAGDIYLPDLICYLLKIMFNSPIFVFFSCWFVANFEVWPKCIKGVKKKIILNNKTYLVFKLCSLVDLKQYQFVSNSCSIRVQFVTILIRIVLHSHIS